MIIGKAHDNTTWVIDREGMDLENLSHSGRNADVPHVLPGQGRPAELPGGGIPRTSGDKDFDAGTFLNRHCPGHRGHFGGGEPLSPTVPSMQHDAQCVKGSDRKRRRLAEK